MSFFHPGEEVRQAGTMMSWPTESSIASDEIYSSAGIDVKDTRNEVANIAKTIAKYQTLHMFVLDAKSKEADAQYDNGNLETARALLSDNDNIQIHTTSNIHSLWARDTGPVPVLSRKGAIENTWSANDDPGLGFTTTTTSSTTVGLNLHFNQWGRKQPMTQDHYLSATVCQQLNISCVSAPFTAEGGGLEFDGHGTLLATRSAIINPNRNPGWSAPDLEAAFATYFGVTKTIWLPGVRGRDITDDHIDALARFGGGGETVLLSKPGLGREQRDVDAWREAKEILERETDALGRKLRVIDVIEPEPTKVLGGDWREEEGPCLSYVNFALVNEAVVMAKFGDEECDRAAKEVIQRAFLGRKVEQVYLHQLALQGGGIHCATHQILPTE